MFEKTGFIGVGNMGGAILRAVARQSGTAGTKLFASGRRPGPVKEIAGETGAVQSTNAGIAKECGLIFLGVKPQVMPDVLAELACVFRQRTDRFVLVTMAAGLSIQSIREMAGGNYPVIRIMPNLPVSVGEGTTLYCSEGVTEDETGEFLALMEQSGILVPLEENLIDAGSAVSGCGPAFVFMFIEALADGGVACGLPRDKAQQLAAQTLLGSARLLQQTGKHPGELKDAVCSPGGTTIAGVNALENGAFRSLAASAVQASYRRTLELKK